MANLDELYTAILTGKLPVAVEVTKEALSQNVDPQCVINEYMVKSMEEIGSRFEAGKAFVPELLMAARAMKGSLELLKPYLSKNDSKPIGKIIIGTVKGDLHDIGKNLVASMFEGCGFEVINLGVDISAKQFADAIDEHDADILCMSALLTTTMNYMREVITTLNELGVRKKVKIMIGGAPVTAEFAKQIGADGYSDNANAAVILARNLLAS